MDAPAAAAPLLVVLPAAGRDGAGLARVSVGGLTVERRIALAAQRAGFGGVVASDRVDLGASATPRRIVALGSNVVPRSPWLRALLEIPLEPETLYLDGDVAVIDTMHADRLIDALARCRGAEDLARSLDGALAIVRHPLEPSGRFPLRGPADVPAAEAWLLRSLIKADEGFMSRHVERRISLAVTRRLAPTSITPNTMTLVSVAIGLVGAPFFLSASPVLQIVGSVLFLLHSILDGCDGELARLKFLESRSGAVLDFWGDNLVHVAVWTCLAVGWSLDTGSAGPLALGALAVASTIAAAFVSADRFIGGRTRAAESAVGRLTAALSHRDFIYLILLLAAFGKARWFLVLTAVGTPLFLAVLLLLLAGGRGVDRRP